jgi:hypothetical protein
VTEVRSHLLGRADLGAVAQRVSERCAQDEPRLSLQLGIYTIWIRESLSALVCSLHAGVDENVVTGRRSPLITHTAWGQLFLAVAG